MDLAELLARPGGIPPRGSVIVVFVIAPWRAGPSATAVIILCRLVGRPIIRSINRPRRGAAIVVALFDQFVEPLADRDAGLPRGLAGRCHGFRAKASEIPRTARFHRGAKPLRKERGSPWFPAKPARQQSGGRGLLSSTDFSGITVNKRLISACRATPWRPPSYGPASPFHRRSSGVNRLGFDCGRSQVPTRKGCSWPKGQP